MDEGGGSWFVYYLLGPRRIKWVKDGSMGKGSCMAYDGMVPFSIITLRERKGKKSLFFLLALLATFHTQAARFQTTWVLCRYRANNPGLQEDLTATDPAKSSEPWNAKAWRMDCPFLRGYVIVSSGVSNILTFVRMEPMIIRRCESVLRVPCFSSNESEDRGKNREWTAGADGIINH